MWMREGSTHRKRKIRLPVHRRISLEPRYHALEPLTDHRNERMRRGDVAGLRVEREAHRLKHPEHKHPCRHHPERQSVSTRCRANEIEKIPTDGGRDEQRAPADLITQQSRDNCDDEVENVEATVLEQVQDQRPMRSARLGADTIA